MSIANHPHAYSQIMDFSKFTLKTQEAIQKAQQIALEKGHQTIENAHLLKGIFEADENVTPFLLKKMNVNVAIFEQALDKMLDSFPKVSGGQEMSLLRKQILRSIGPRIISRNTTMNT